MDEQTNGSTCLTIAGQDVKTLEVVAQSVVLGTCSDPSAGQRGDCVSKNRRKLRLFLQEVADSLRPVERTRRDPPSEK